VDGAMHLLVMSYWKDMDRGNELVIAGHAQLRFPSIAFHLDRDVSQIRSAEPSGPRNNDAAQPESPALSTRRQSHRAA
jgi:hypothetical protein